MGSLVNSVLSTVVYQADMHFDKETHRETERPRLQFSADRVRKRQGKTEISGKEARMTLGGWLVQDGQEVEIEANLNSAWHPLATLNPKGPYSGHSSSPPQNPGPD